VEPPAAWEDVARIGMLAWLAPVSARMGMASAALDEHAERRQ
jgi:hypothetical protein